MEEETRRGKDEAVLSADHWQAPLEDDGERALRVGLPKGRLSEVTARRGMEPH